MGNPGNVENGVGMGEIRVRMRESRWECKDEVRMQEI